MNDLTITELVPTEVEAIEATLVPEVEEGYAQVGEGPVASATEICPL